MDPYDPLHTPRALGTVPHPTGTFPHQWRSQGPLPLRRFPHQRVRSRLLFLVGLLLSPPPPRNRMLSQAQGKVSLRSSVLYFLAGRRSSASTSTDWLKQAAPAPCVSFPTHLPSTTSAPTQRRHGRLKDWAQALPQQLPQWHQQRHRSTTHSFLY